MTEPYRKAHDAAERAIAVCDVLPGLLRSDVDAFTADLRTQWAVEMGPIRIGEAVQRTPGACGAPPPATLPNSAPTSST